MSTDLQAKLARLAFDSSAYEAEAVAAFLHLRRLSFNPLVALVVEKVTASWEATVNARNFDDFIVGLNNFKLDPYYQIEFVNRRKFVNDAYKIKLNVEFKNTEEKVRFTYHIKDMFARMN